MAAAIICVMMGPDTHTVGLMYAGVPTLRPIHSTPITPRMMPPVWTKTSTNRPELVTT